jgi:hypothetical protein
MRQPLNVIVVVVNGACRITAGVDARTTDVRTYANETAPQRSEVKDAIEPIERLVIPRGRIRASAASDEFHLLCRKIAHVDPQYVGSAAKGAAGQESFAAHHLSRRTAA